MAEGEDLAWLEGLSPWPTGGFGVERADKKAMWRESLGEIVKMMTDDPYEGFEGDFFSMPARNRPLASMAHASAMSSVTRRPR